MPIVASPSPVRHGLCRLTLRIGGTNYRLRPMPPQPGFHAVWILRKLDSERSAVYTVAHAKGEETLGVPAEILDMPFSFLFDTFLLPFDAFVPELVSGPGPGEAPWH